jgi:trehalose 6-phosphate phosphatase
MLTEHTARLAARAHLTAICLDFDGTLAPIVDDPNEARPLPGTVELLGHLAARFAAVALLSGRPADYLAKHAAAPGVRYLGLYGLQEIRDGDVWVDPRLEAAQPAVMAAQQDLRDCAAVRDSGAYLEDKQYAVAIHTRRVADAARWTTPIDEAARQVAERHGLDVVLGKLVWELRPAVRNNKGDAVRRIISESNARSVVVAGDDLGDLSRIQARLQLRLSKHDGTCQCRHHDRGTAGCASSNPSKTGSFRSMSRAAQFDCTICTALAPKAVFTMRKYATNPPPTDPDQCTTSNLQDQQPAGHRPRPTRRPALPAPSTAKSRFARALRRHRPTVR